MINVSRHNKKLKKIFYIKYFEVSETFRDIMWIFFFGIHKNKLLDDFVPTRYVLLSARYAFLVLPILPMIDRKITIKQKYFIFVEIFGSVWLTG